MDPHGDLGPSIRLFHHRWSVPITYVLREGDRSQAELQQRLGASRDTLTATIASLEREGVVERLQAGGRTRYALREAARPVADATVPVVEAVRASGTLSVGLKKWPFVTLTAIGRGIARYNELKAALPGITPRALSACLHDLVDADLVERRIQPGFPPTNLYLPAPRSEPLLAPLDALCRAAAVFDEREKRREKGEEAV